jgi:hypothetical protein
MQRRLYRLNELQENAKDRSAYGGPKGGVTEFACKFQHL